MKKILISSAIIGVVAGITLGITGAWWSDVQTDTNQSFSAGTLKLWLDDANPAASENETQTWNISNMAPGDPAQSGTLFIKNVGSVAADHIKLAISNTVSGNNPAGNPVPSDMDEYLEIARLNYAPGTNNVDLLIDVGNYREPDIDAAACKASSTCWVVGTSANAERTQIQLAIEAASAGDTILVEPGTYKGTILVHKSVTIKSFGGPGTTIIDASQRKLPTWQTCLEQFVDLYKFGFIVTADDVVIEGFKIENANVVTDEGAGPQNNRGIGIILGSISTTYTWANPNSYDEYCGLKNSAPTYEVTGCRIAQNIIEDANTGIHVWKSDDNVVENNVIYGSIYAEGGDTAETGSGIVLYDGGTNNQFKDNVVFDNDLYGFSFGAYSYDGDLNNTVVERNVFSNNTAGVNMKTRNGKHFTGNVAINGNNIAYNSTYGLSVTNMWSSIDATGNYWTKNASGNVYDPSSKVNASTWLSDPANVDTFWLDDFSGNGFVDLGDFEMINLNVEPAPAVSGQKNLVMDVGLNGSAGNDYQNGTVGMTMTVGLYQNKSQ